jgi:FAD dependent oxidoreductase TIGR03364
LTRYDLAVVGGGIVGLAHAYEASRRGLKVVLFDRDSRANGASVRNFGFITITGQPAGDTWRRARHSRDVWANIAAQARIPILHRGLTLLTHSDAARTVIEEFVSGPMGDGCRVMEPAEALNFCPGARAEGLTGALYSPHELRVESREAVHQVAAWLQETQGVTIIRPTSVLKVTPPLIETSVGSFKASRAVVCPGHDFVTLFPDVIARHKPQECKLHMLRLSDPGWRLQGAVMNDLGLTRYLGYADCPSLPALRQKLMAEQPEAFDNGIHLIVVQSADGSLVVGDSHHYGATVDDFAPDHVDDLIIRIGNDALDLSRSKVSERWIGIYASAAVPAMIEEAGPDIRVVVVTSGTGASTAFGLAKDCLDGLYPA